MKKYPYNIERAVNGLSMKNPGWSIDVLLIADLVMEYIGKNNVSVDQVELSLVNGCLGINGILVERVALLPCKYGAKEKIPKEMREKWTPGGYDAGGFLIVDVDQ